MNQKPNDDRLRESVGPSFNIFLATVAMISIFMGFVFAALLRLLAGTEALSLHEEWAIELLVACMLLFLSALIGFHATAHQVVRYWNFFVPESFARTTASLLFVLGIITMLSATTVMLWNKSFWITGWVVLWAAILFLIFELWFGSIHKKNQCYVRKVDGSKAKQTADLGDC